MRLLLWIPNVLQTYKILVELTHCQGTYELVL